MCKGIFLQLLDCGDRAFESRWGHGCSSVVLVMWVAAYAMSWSSVQRGPTARARSSNCVWRTTSTMKWPKLELGCCVTKREREREYYSLLLCYVISYYSPSTSRSSKCFILFIFYYQKCIFHFTGITHVYANSSGYILLFDNIWEVRHPKLTTVEVSAYWNYNLSLLLLLLTENELSLCGSSPYTSTDKTNKNKCT